MPVEHFLTGIPPLMVYVAVGLVIGLESLGIPLPGEIVLVSAALFARSASNAGRLDLGFRTDRLLLLSTNTRLLGYDSTRAQVFYDELVRRARALPGVRSAALAGIRPVRRQGLATTFIDT